MLIRFEEETWIERCFGFWGVGKGDRCRSVVQIKLQCHRFLTLDVQNS